MTLVSLLGKNDRKLKKYCRKCVRQGIKTPAAVWVCDNYPTCSSAIKAAKSYASHNGECKLLPLFFLCSEFISKEENLSSKSISSFFSSRKLTIRECDALPVLLFAAAACVAVNSESEDVVIRCVKNLNELKNISFEDMRYNISAAERYLVDDPSGIYEKMNESTKKMYRDAVIKGAKAEGTDEAEYIKGITAKAREKNGENAHTGFFLPVIPDRRIKGIAFIASEWLLALLLSVLAGLLFSGRIYAVFLIFLPVLAVVRAVGDKISPRLFPARRIPALKAGETGDSNTLIVVSSLLPDATKTEKLSSHLEALYRADSGKNIKIMLLLDMKNSDTPEKASDEADINSVRRLIHSLNEKYGGGFCAAVRERVYSPAEDEYTGFERKRGAINALMRYLRDKNAENFLAVFGDTEKLSSMEYALMLDSDTDMCFEVLSELLAYARHPLNKFVVDSNENRITSGYGIFCPRIETSVEACRKTVFSEVFTDGGYSSYAAEINERNTDMFAEGIFTGKGLIDIDAFNEILTDKLDNNRILSHDILEGNILRTALCSDCVLTESFPLNASGYFSRLHRWIRGDVQNLKYIFRKTGAHGDSPRLSPVGKYQLIDNVRREITPVVSLLLLVLSCFVPYYTALLFLAVAVISVSVNEISSLVTFFAKGGIRVFFDLYLSKDFPRAIKTVIRFILNTGSLPELSFRTADGTFRALFRMLISGKKLLQWTTATDAEKRNRKNYVISALLPSAVAAILFFEGFGLHRLIALFILIFIPLSLSDGIKIKEHGEKVFTENEKQTIRSFAAASWRFFSENVSSFENWLPPDNIQETPVYAKAKRTSPTNIGLYLVSILAACDMALITPDEAITRIRNTLFSVERLPKYRGLLYNWYDTVTMKPLQPQYVSTVDCGNFLACLTALKEGLREFSDKNQDVSELIALAEKLANESATEILYDKNRRLFRIGIDAQSGEKSQSFYDYYMSEARMTSYYECARRRVPVEHWGALDRSVRRNGNYVSAVSWTGTMFEYFMPALFMPVVKGTYQYEGLKNALYMQKKFARARGIPFGISESCYFSFDPSLNYRYKAHGIKALAMKREDTEECVVSPYSTFLCLCFDKKSAMKNLSRLSSLHCEGRCGFYEAVDFTKKRIGSEDYEIIRAYMAHHVGMSLVAMANALHDNIFVRRFMSDERMSSAECLIKEKLPAHPLVVSAPVRRNSVKEKYTDIFRNNKKKATDEACAWAYSDGRVTLLADKIGRTRSVYAAHELLRFSDVTKGISIGVEYDGHIYPLFPSEKAEIRSYSLFSEITVGSVEISAALAVHPYTGTILCPVRIKNNSGDSISVKLHFYAEPLLLPLYENERHPAFSDMFLRTKLSASGDVVSVYRVNAESTPAVSFSVCSPHHVSFCLDREMIIKRTIGAENVFERGYHFRKSEIRGVYPCVAMLSVLEIPDNKSDECVFTASAGRNVSDSLHSLNRVKSTSLAHITKCRQAAFTDDVLMLPTVNSLVANGFFGGNISRSIRLAGEKFNKDKGTLWAAGISGDLPVITVFADKNCPESMKRAFVRLYRNLRNASLKTDLVFVFEKGAEYIPTVEIQLMRIIREFGEDDNVGIKGGIHILSEKMLSEDTLNAIVAFSSAVYPDDADAQIFPGKGFSGITKNENKTQEDNGFSEYGFIVGEKPCVPWSHTLSNSTFGTLVTDSSIGFTWCYNSSQNMLTPWSGDIMADLSGERLMLRTENGLYDAVDGARVHFTHAFAEYFNKIDGIELTLRISVPEKGMRKRLSVKMKNYGHNRNASLLYCTFPVLGTIKAPDSILKISKGKNCVLVRNPLDSEYKGLMMISCYGRNVLPFSDLKETGEGSGQCVGILQKFAIDKNKEISTSFFLSYGKDINSLEKAEKLPFAEKQLRRYEYDTGYPSLDVLASSVLYHQVTDTRIRARTGFYQCSGAWGFRDQLQDACAVTSHDNRLALQIILRMAAAQFYEGDVLHWFHLTHDKRHVYKGVRTRCSDDMLWLAYAVGDYVLRTGETDILELEIPFLDGEGLSENQKEHYGCYYHGGKSGTLLLHCLKAIGCAYKTGEHALPLMGTGDWNDSFNAVGEKGKGESVWLGMFLRHVLIIFAKVCDMCKKHEDAQALKKVASSLALSIDNNAWNGEWYIRGFYDDSSPLGEKGCDGCEIDLLVAAWSSLSDMPHKNRVRSSLKAAYERLFDEKNGVVKLFTPAFNEKNRYTGYVNHYPEGMRENGGQYTHAAVWFVMALFREGLTDMAERVLEALLPPEKYRNGMGAIYKNEPYALSGDVYSATGHEGRGGWSLYTGSAGWLLRLVDELDEKRRNEKRRNE